MLGISIVEKRVTSRLFQLALIFMGVLFLGSCKKDQPKDQENETPKKLETPEKQKTPEEILAGFKKEVYGDPKIFSTPRLQFLWSPRGVDLLSVWTMTLDGNDLRLAAGFDLIYKYAYKKNRVSNFVRSPDNRYLVFNASCIEDDGDHECKFLIDLKTKTSKVIAKGGSQPLFQWTSDSKTVVFYLRTSTMEYNVEKDQLKERPMIYSQGFHILPKDNQIMTINDSSYSYFTYEGKLIKKIVLGKQISDSHSLTPDGKYLLYSADRDFIIDTEKPKEPLFVFNAGDLNSSTIISPDGKSLFYAGGMTFYQMDLQTKTEHRIVEYAGGSDVYDLSIINNNIN